MVAAWADIGTAFEHRNHCELRRQIPIRDNPKKPLGFASRLIAAAESRAPGNPYQVFTLGFLLRDEQARS